MYESHFRLRQKPFTILPDPGFIYWSKNHTRAFAMLEYSIINHAGFTVITGEIGCGKTTLIRYLLSQVTNGILVGILPDTQILSKDLIKWALLAFEQNIDQTSEVAAFRDFRNFIHEQARIGRRVALIVDEAQNLSVAGLEKLRMLSNINTEQQNTLQIILAGQPQLREILRRPELVQFMQRVSAEFNIEPLPFAEVKNYILHRLKIAESPTALFSDKAVQKIAEESKGIPRVVNILCDTALVYAFARGVDYVDSRIVKHVIQDRHRQSTLTDPEIEVQTGLGHVHDPAAI